MILDAVAFTLIILGSLFLLLGSVGIVRFPDFYCRTHAMTKPDTMGLILTLSGLALLNGWDLDSLKLFLIVLFVAIANSASSHALGRAALRTGLKAWVREGKQ